MDDVVRSLAEETGKPKQEELAPMLDDAVEETLSGRAHATTVRETRRTMGKNP